MSSEWGGPAVLRIVTALHSVRRSERLAGPRAGARSWNGRWLPQLGTNPCRFSRAISACAKRNSELAFMHGTKREQSQAKYSPLLCHQRFEGGVRRRGILKRPLKYLPILGAKDQRSAARTARIKKDVICHAALLKFACNPVSISLKVARKAPSNIAWSFIVGNSTNGGMVLLSCNSRSQINALANGGRSSPHQ